MAKKSEEKKDIKAESTEIVDPVAVKLKELGVDDATIEKIKSVLGAETVEDLSELTEDYLVRPEIGMKPIKASKLVKALTSVKTAYSASETAAATAVSNISFDAILPQVPSDDSWLAALKAGGILKVDQSTVISAIRAALAHRAGLYDIPGILSAKMEQFADSNEDQVTPEFYVLRKQMTKRSYAEIFEAIEGLDGSFVTEARKKQLFDRIDRNLWQAIVGFYNQLKSWQEAWMQGAASPAVLMSAVLTASGGMGAMPAGMIQPPDTGVLRDAADEVSNSINKIFAGTGVQIVAALAYDATKIKETLSNTRLPAMIGAANRDQMLRQLGVAVPATYPRMEQNLTRFVLSILQVKDQPAGNEELQYFGTLYMLGSQIPWDQLDGRSIIKKPSGIGK